MTDLHVAAALGLKNTVAHLLGLKDHDINARDSYGSTPLQAAVLNKNESIVRMLIDRGADVNFGEKNGISSLHVAAEIGDLSLGFPSCLISTPSLRWDGVRDESCKVIRANIGRVCTFLRIYIYNLSGSNFPRLTAELIC